MSDRDLGRVQTRVCERRREQADQQWRQDPISEYRDELTERLTKQDAKTRLRIIQRFEAHLLTEIDPQTELDIQGVRDAVSDDVTHWKDLDLVPDPSIQASTVVENLVFLKSFYKRLNEVNAYAGNPVTTVLKEYKRNHADELDTGSPYIPFGRLKTFLNWLDTPFGRVSWLIAFKLGVRKGEFVNLDLRCLNIDHPIFREIIDEHDIVIDPRIRDHPDTMLIYEGFNKTTEMPNENISGWNEAGELRKAGNKRKQDDGSVLPVESELKTAIIEWLLVRPATYDESIHPLITVGTKDPTRPTSKTIADRLWSEDSHCDSIQQFVEQESLTDCPTCGHALVERNLIDAKKTGRRYICRNCTATHWRSIYWDPDEDLDNKQKMTYHQGRHSFSSAHSPENSDLHDDAIPDKVRKVHIRGDSNEQGDTEDTDYIEEQYVDFEEDVRRPYLDGIYKFNIYDNPIPAVGEGGR